MVSLLLNFYKLISHSLSQWTGKESKNQQRQAVRPIPNRAPSQNQRCQNCFQFGHWTSQCKNEAVYLKRPSRSKLLQKPNLREKLIPTGAPPPDPAVA